MTKLFENPFLWEDLKTLLNDIASCKEEEISFKNRKESQESVNIRGLELNSTEEISFMKSCDSFAQKVLQESKDKIFYAEKFVGRPKIDHTLPSYIWGKNVQTSPSFFSDFSPSPYRIQDLRQREILAIVIENLASQKNVSYETFCDLYSVYREKFKPVNKNFLEQVIKDNVLSWLPHHSSLGDHNNGREEGRNYISIDMQRVVDKSDSIVKIVNGWLECCNAMQHFISVAGHVASATEYFGLNLNSRVIPMRRPYAELYIVEFNPNLS